MDVEKFTDTELRVIAAQHRENANRGNAHFFGEREVLDEAYVKRQRKLAALVEELLEYRRKEEENVKGA